MDLRELANLKARQYGVDPAFVQRVIHTESRGNPNAVSSAGARGVMQIMPATAIGLGVDPSQLSNPEINTDAGVRYLRQMLNRFGGNEQLAAMAYNAGPGRVEKLQARYGASPTAIFAHLPVETQKYARATASGGASLPSVSIPVSVPVHASARIPVSAGFPELSRLQLYQQMFPATPVDIPLASDEPDLMSEDIFPSLASLVSETRKPVEPIVTQYLPTWSSLFS